MASCITSQWVSTAPQMKLSVVEVSSSGTSVTLRWTLEYVASYPASTSGNNSYTVTVNGETINGSYYINGKTGTHTVDSDTFTVTRGSSSKTINFSVSVAWNLTWSGVYCGTKSANGSIAISAISSYTVSYNANGGSGAPSSQTKKHGVSITLASTKPTRTGYTFQGWATSSNATTVSYAAGATYSDDSDITLYAVWKAKTYTVKYYANGGSGEPATQTKTHGVGLKLSTTIPTRTNYTFLGWGISASSTTVSFSPGATYTVDNDIELYAIWSLAYTPPRVTNVTMVRCTSNGTSNDSGTYARVKFSWACDYAVYVIAIQWKSSAETSWLSTAVTASGTSGTVDKIIGSGSLDPDATYTVIATVIDSSGGSTPVTKTLSGLKFMMDFMDDNSGAAIGKAAEVEGVFDIGFQTRLTGGILHPILETGTNINDVTVPNTYVLSSDRTYTNAPESNVGAVLEVIGSSSRLQRYTVISKTNPRSYERAHYSGSWGDWQEVTRDTGWIDAALASEFVVYDSSAANLVRYRKVGKQVEIRGGVKPAIDGIGGDTSQHIIFTLPEGFRPSSALYWRCQGSNSETWMLSVTSGGEVRFARYGDGMGMFPADTSAWLPFQANFFIG